MAVPFVKVDASQNPNLSLKAGSDAALPYYRAMVVSFASVRRFNPGAELKLVSNSSVPEAVAQTFDFLGVELMAAPFDHRPPAGFTDRFEASLYMLDALAALGSESCLVIDPDVLCVRSLRQILDFAGGSAGALRINFEPDHNVNGLSRRQAGELHALLGEPHPAPPYFGGEAYFIPQEHSEMIRARAERAWSLALSRYGEGAPKFVTEEHLLSYALRGVRTVDLNASVKRIWTARRFRNVTGGERDLTLWHLPAEKGRGFAELHPLAIDPQSWFWTSTAEDFVERAGRAMGVFNRSAPRVAMDLAGQASNRFRKTLARLK